MEHELRAFAEAIDTILGALQAAGRIELAPGGLVSLILVGGISPRHSYNGGRALSPRSRKYKNLLTT
ncbi:hypothetical protein CIK74_15880 [Glutamicibacter sp. BW77]|nr:hypothetical protein CIK74_15880 [Glutamicibacter sp. BW77]